MVELKLESLDMHNLTKDVYVSVRVGEAQKFSRVAAEKTYKFPASVCSVRRYGKVEVFRRVGSTPVDIRPEDGIVQEIAVPGGDDDDGKLHFRVSLVGEGGSNDPKRIEHLPVDLPEQPEKPPNPKMLEAKKYLLHHNLEMRLSEAMRTVLQDRPENPAAYIGEKLAESAGAVRKIKLSQANHEDSEQAKPGDADDLREPPRPGDANDLLEQAKPGDADDPREQAKPSDASDLREQAKQALLNASSNGQLERTLTELILKKSQQQDSYDSLREQARLTLLSASADGRLDAALSDSKIEQGGPSDDTHREQAQQTLLNDLREQAKPGDADDLQEKAKPGDASDLREQAKQALLNASSNGQLERTLTELSLKNSQQHDSYDSLRQQARLTLLSASGDGRLDAALSDLKVEQGGPSEDALRDQAQQTLLNASSDGLLSAALEECMKMKNETPQSVNPNKKSVDDMHKEAKNSLLLARANETLLHASAENRLIAASGDLDCPKTDAVTVEHIQGQAKSVQLSASQDGCSAAVLAAAKQESPQPDSEDLRRQAKQTLLEASASGHLDEALQSLRAQTACTETPAYETTKEAEALAAVKQESPQPDSKDLRRQAKQTLLEASASGHLDEALQSLRAQTTCTEAPACETTEDVEEKQSGLHVLPLQAMYGPVFYSSNLNPNLRTI